MSNYLPTDYQSFIHKSRYAKYFDGKGRESWGETVERYMDNVVRKVAGDDTYINQIRDAIYRLRDYAKHESHDDEWTCIRQR